MSLWKIAWRSVQQRALASALTAISMALGVTLVVSILIIHTIVSESFKNNSSLGYNVVVGAKGGALQLVLNSVFYLDDPIENVPYTFYQEFLTAEEREDGKDGQFCRMSDGQPVLAIPVCLGDYYKTYRVVGTNTKLFDELVYDVDKNRKFEFSEGRNFVYKSKEHGFFECVVGATVAREAKLKVGDSIVPSHGAPEGEGEAHDEDLFHVVGILKASGTPNDRAVFVNIEGFLLIEDHQKPIEESDETDESTEEEEAIESEQAVEETAHHGHDHKGDRQPLPIAQREVTSILVKTDPFGSMYINNKINEGNVAQAVMPIAVIYSLLDGIVKPVQTVLLIITALICVVSGISILVSIYNSMSDRRHEIAVMRALGAGRRTVLLVVLFESIILSLGGGLGGWMGGHVLIGAFGTMIEERTGVTVGLFSSSIVELTLIPSLILLAILVGFLPAVSAYRTDVAQALSSSP